MAFQRLKVGNVALARAFYEVLFDAPCEIAAETGEMFIVARRHPNGRPRWGLVFDLVDRLRDEDRTVPTPVMELRVWDVDK